jgi:hypothetical protein
MKIPWIVIADHGFLFQLVIIFVNSSTRVMIRSINLYRRLSGQRLTYTLLFLAKAALLGEVDLLFAAARAVLSLVGEAAFDLVAALASIDFDGVARGFLVMEGATRGFFGLS